MGMTVIIGLHGLCAHEKLLLIIGLTKEICGFSGEKFGEIALPS